MKEKGSDLRWSLTLVLVNSSGLQAWLMLKTSHQNVRILEHKT